MLNIIINCCQAIPVDNKFFDSKENLFAAFFACTPFFIYLGRAFFYIHFFIVLAIFIVFYLKKVKKEGFGYFLKILILYFVVSVLINIAPSEFGAFDNSEKALSVFFMTSAFCLCCAQVYCFSKNSNNNQIVSLKTIFYTASLASFIVLLGWFFDVNIIHSVKYKKIVTFKDWQFHSAHNFLALCTGFLLYYFSKNKSILNSICLGIFFMGALASQGRTAIITISACSALYIFLSSRYRFKLKTYALIAVLFMTALFSVTYISSGDPFAFTKIHTSNRTSGGLKYIEYVAEHSPITGLGVDGPDHLRNEKVIRYGSPHNLFLDAYVTMGAVGLVWFTLFLLLLGVGIKRLYACSQDRHAKAMLVTVFAAWPIDGQAFLSIWSKHNMVLVFFCLFLAIAIVRSGLPDKE